MPNIAANDGLTPISGGGTIEGWPTSDLGYSLGYLRHGSFRSGRVRWPGRLRRVAARALAVLIALRSRRAVRPSCGLDACRARRLPLPVCAACRPVACRGDAVAVMGALLSMSLVDVMGVAVDPSRLSTAFCRVLESAPPTSA